MCPEASTVFPVLAWVEYALTGCKLLIWGVKNLGGCGLNEKDLTDNP